MRLSATLSARLRAIRCRMTSLSLVVEKIDPCSSMALRSCGAFTRLPLCARLMAPLALATWIGCALMSSDDPDVL
jgi:hypothetical protein